MEDNPFDIASVEVPQPGGEGRAGFGGLSRLLPGGAASAAPRFDIGMERPVLDEVNLGDASGGGEALFDVLFPLSWCCTGLE